MPSLNEADAWSNQNPQDHFAPLYPEKARRRSRIYWNSVKPGNTPVDHQRLVIEVDQQAMQHAHQAMEKTPNSI